MINHIAKLSSDLVHWAAVVINNAFQILVSILLLLYEATTCWWRFPTICFIVFFSCIKYLNRDRLPLYSSLLCVPDTISLSTLRSGECAGFSVLQMNRRRRTFCRNSWQIPDVWNWYCNTLLITTADKSLRNMDKLSIISYVSSCLNIVSYSFSLFCIFLFLSLV